ncbi:MAG: hypothetical protein ABIU77_24895, partial [Ferruginibacter sp.]
VTWYEWAKVMAINAGLDEQLIVEGAGANTAVSRPFNSGLQSEKYFHMPSWQNALNECLQTINQAGIFSAV